MPKTYTLTGTTGTGKNVSLPVRILHTDKFKAGMLSLSCALPIRSRVIIKVTKADIIVLISAM